LSSPKPPPNVATPPARLETAALLAEVAEFPELAPTLEAVEDRLAEVVRSRPGMLGDAAEHLLFAGGKRVRPALSILFGHLGAGARFGEAEPAVVDAAVACELVHLGSLYHDDVIDEANTRRGVPTVNTKWSNTVAVLAGDYLLGAASELAAALGAEPASVLAWTICELVEGEVAELTNLFNHDATIPHYLSVIEAKTASLMGSACWLGTRVAGGDRADAERAKTFGTELGMVFQIVDDVLDLVADEAATGKRRGIDLSEGVYTLPTLAALEADHDETLRKLLVTAPDAQQVEDAIDHISAAGGIALAVDAAAERLARCDALLESWAPAPAQAALSRLSRYVLDRVPLEL